MMLPESWLAEKPIEDAPFTDSNAHPDESFIELDEYHHLD
jgi:hypothetical protein